MNVDDDGWNGRFGQQGGRRFGLWNGDDEAVVVLVQCGADALGREFRRRSDKRNVPVVIPAEIAKDAVQFVLPGDSRHLQGDENSLLHGGSIPKTDGRCAPFRGVRQLLSLWIRLLLGHFG